MNRRLTAGPYVLQAAIASLQTEQHIDWQQVAALYGELARITRSPLHSTRAGLLRRLGRIDDARTAYERALQLSRTGPEHQFLKRRLGEL